MSHHLSVGLPREDLRTHVVRSADDGRGHVIGRVQHSSDAQVADLDDVILRQEDILRFQISMQDTLLVHVLEQGSQ